MFNFDFELEHIALCKVLVSIQMESSTHIEQIISLIGNKECALIEN